MITRKGTAALALILSLSLALPLLAEQRGRGNQEPAPPVNYNPRPQSAEEAAAFNAAANESNPANRIALADTFVTSFPDSSLLGIMHRLRMDTFSSMGRFADAAAAGEQGLALESKYVEDLTKLADEQAAAARNNNDRNNRNNRNQPAGPPPIDKNSPAFQELVKNTEQTKMYYYQNIMNAYQQLDDAAKAIEWGRKALAHSPNDLLTLLSLSSVMAERPPDDENANTQMMNEAHGLAQKAMQQVTDIVNNPVFSAQMSADQKADLVSTARSTLGRIYINQEKYRDAQREYSEALKVKNNDAIAYFFLGMAYAQDEPQKITEAMDAFAKSVFLKGPTEAQARDILKQIYEQQNKTSEGLDQFIAQAGAKIGQ